MNPIENLWAVMARRVSDMGPRSVSELEVFVRKAWEALPQTMVDTMVASFQKRKNHVVQAGGL